MCSEKDICAIIVTYNCDERIKKSVKALKQQGVQKIVVVDNASGEEGKMLIQSLEDELIIHWNDKNEGLARALNKGIEKAQEEKCKLVLTLDQDSVLEDDAIAHMLNVLNAQQDIVSVGPNYNNLNLKAEYIYQEFLITSGNLTYMEAIQKIGGFDNRLFIDSIDFDFSLRLRELGKLAMVSKAKMNHKIGEYEEGRFLFWKRKLLSHSVLRHYYMYRNGVYIIKRYKKKYPKFCMKKLFFSVKYIFEVILFQKDKRNKMHMIWRGIRDGVMGRWEADI